MIILGSSVQGSAQSFKADGAVLGTLSDRIERGCLRKTNFLKIEKVIKIVVCIQRPPNRRRAKITELENANACYKELSNNYG